MQNKNKNRKERKLNVRLVKHSLNKQLEYAVEGYFQLYSLLKEKILAAY